MNSGHGITPLTPGAGSQSSRELDPGLPGTWVLASLGAGSSAKELIFAMYVEDHIELGCEFRTWDHPSDPGKWVPASPGAGYSAKELIFTMYVEDHIELGCELRIWDHSSDPGSWVPASLGAGSSAKELIFAMYVEDWKIALPKLLLQPTIKMYHLVA